MPSRQPLSYFLSLEYPMHTIPDPEGGYVVIFPDLPGCMTQIDDLSELPLQAAEIKALWIETEYEHGAEIPLPALPESYSGKFNLRLPKSLHRRLAEQAEADGVSLNQLVLTLLAERQGALEMVSALQEILSSRQPARAEEVQTQHGDHEPRAAGYTVDTGSVHESDTASEGTARRLRLVPVAA